MYRVICFDYKKHYYDVLFTVEVCLGLWNLLHVRHMILAVTLTLNEDAL